MTDAVTCGLADQKTPDGYYNIGRMVKAFISKGGKIKACGTCMDARGMSELTLQKGVEKSNMSELGHRTIEADKVISF